MIKFFKLFAAFLVAAVLQAANACAVERTLVLGSFETGLDGFDDTMQIDTKEFKVGQASGRLVNTNQDWVGSVRDQLNLEYDFREIRLWYKAAAKGNLCVRLLDARGQYYLHRVELPGDRDWHQFVFTKLNDGESWGGPKDGQWHAPAQEIALILEGHGAVWVDDLTAVLETGRTVPEFTVVPRVPGNVFVAGEKVEIVIDTRAAKLEFQVQDFWGKTVASGAAVPDAEHRAVLKPIVQARGQFAAKITSWEDGKPTVREVDFAVIEPVELAKLRDSPFGVMTHFSQGWKTGIIPLIARVGFSFVRDEMPWNEVERTTGEFSFDRFVPYMDELTRNGIRPLMLMTYDNPLYDGGNTPYTPAGRAAYGRYGQEIIKRFGDRLLGIEIWNEYNGSWCKGPAAEDRPRSQAELCRVVYPMLKQARPDITVLGGAAVLLPLPYFAGVFKNGGLKGMDAVVIHPYRSRPEGLDGEIGELRDLMKQHLQGQEKPIWATEYGSFSPDPKVSARYYVRISTLMLSQGVKRMIWYLMQDHREFANMGIVHGPRDPRGPYSPAPVLGAAAVVVRLLSDARYVEREATRHYSRAFVFKFLKGNEQLRVCWATYPARIRLQADGPVSRIDLMGNPQPVALENGSAVLDLDDTPFYLRGSIKTLTEVETGTSVVADMCDDFSRVQGATGWYYGYFDGTGGGKGNGIEPSGPYTDDDFKPFTLEVTPWGDRWHGSQEYLSASRGEMHPQVKDKCAVWAVERWKGSVSGPVTIEGTVDRSREGDGVTFIILVDGRRVYERHVGGPRDETRVSFSVKTEIGSGALVDFAVTPGPANNIANDSTTVDARVIVGNQ